MLLYRNKKQAERKKCFYCSYEKRVYLLYSKIGYIFHYYLVVIEKFYIFLVKRKYFFILLSKIFLFIFERKENYVKLYCYSKNYEHITSYLFFSYIIKAIRDSAP